MFPAGAAEESPPILAPIIVKIVLTFDAEDKGKEKDSSVQGTCRKIPNMIYNTPSGWTVVFGDKRIQKEIDRLDDDVRAHLWEIVTLIERVGLENVHEPYVKHLRGKLWEMRMRGKDGIARAVYITTHGKRIVVLHAFVKKTQQTPPEVIELALKRAKELGCL